MMSRKTYPRKMCIIVVYTAIMAKIKQKFFSFYKCYLNLYKVVKVKCKMFTF